MNKIMILLLISLTLYGNDLFQVSTYKALEEGVCNGNIPYGDVFKKGDFGLGTFNGTDGEMIALDGAFYHDSPTGLLRLVRPTEKTPFAAVIFFEGKEAVKIRSAKSFERLGKMLDHFIEKHNTPYAIRIDGNFRYIKLRSLNKQKPPYKPLAEAVKEQHEYEFYEIKGTLVGFWFPMYLDGINRGGYHFHFIDADKKRGGHVLDLSLKSGEAYFQPSTSLTIDFPNTPPFNHADLYRNNKR